MEFLNGHPWNSCRVDALRLASLAEKGVVKEHAQWRNPKLKSRADATRSSVAEGMDAAIAA